MIQQNTPGWPCKSIGISDIGVYIADQGLSVHDLIEGRSRGDTALRQRLHKSNQISGQQYVRFPRPWEDAVTMGTEASRRVLDRNKDRGQGPIRLLSVGTETSVDHAKPVAAYVQGLLKAGGIDLGTSLTTLQLQHACAGSTMGLLHSAGFLSMGARPGEQALVVSTDISRYVTASSAELTQGAGAVSVLVEHNPRLLEIDLATVGQYSTDVDDFFRPLGQPAAQVRGGHSIKCYRKAFAAAFGDHCQRRNEKETDVIRQTDFFVLHTPFRNMPEMAFEWFLHKHGLGGNGDGLFARTEGSCLREATDEVAFSGNLYNGSLYFVLAHLLQNLFHKLGTAMIGKRIILGSYGSGATMIVLSATIAADAVDVIRQWALPSRTSAITQENYETFEQWANTYDKDQGKGTPSEPNQFYLKEIRKDGYRLYGIS
jgi:hydroxymethylglutaryl-CoA synthase